MKKKILLLCRDTINEDLSWQISMFNRDSVGVTIVSENPFLTLYFKQQRQTVKLHGYITHNKTPTILYPF